MPDGTQLLSWQISVVFYEFKIWPLIIKSGDMIYLTIAISDGFQSNHRILMVFDACPPSVKRSDAMDHRSSLKVCET